jgi:hypothetical protein
MRKFVFLALAGVWVLLPARAEMERYSTVDCDSNQICFYVWPKLPALPGWHSDRKANFKYRINTLVPDGFGFSNADAILYANAVEKTDYKTDHPGPDTIAGFIEDDKDTFRKNNPDVVISGSEALKTADGQVLRVLSFAKLKGGHTQIVAYGQEDDYFIVFVMDAGSDATLAKDMDAFRKMVSLYAAGDEAARKANKGRYTIIKLEK